LARRTHPFLTERGRELGARRRRLCVVRCGHLQLVGETLASTKAGVEAVVADTSFLLSE
jgi:hypothetical protein